MTRATNVQVPSVLVVLVVKDGAPWLRECLRALAAQTYPRVGVLAVDNASRDGSREVLEQALGPGRVLALERNAGVAGAVREALARIPAAREADYLLVLHDDTVLAADAVERLVAAAGLEGVERVGVVGPKVVDWEDPRILREVGRSTDRFGHPSTPLQDGEVDHGQYDRVREVLFVSSAAMLVAREAWERTGPFDERLVSHHEDLDFCWRARVAGFRVLMTPLATARHRGAATRGERPARGGRRYEAERAALAAMLKNYSAVTLAWLLPLYLVVGAARLGLLLLGRRLEEAWELVRAWGWNLRHLPGTLRRRVRAQAVRSVPDREVRRFMESAILRLPRWFETAGRILAEQQELDQEETAGVRVHAASLARAHPVLVAWAVALAVGALAVRRFLGPDVLQGGVLPAFPARPEGFFAELASGVRTTALGGADPASPALAALGVLSFLSGASTALAQKVLLAAGVPLAGAMLYRSTLRRTEHRAAAVVAGAAYATSAVVLWAFSEGRIGLLVALAMLPLVAERIDAAARTAVPAWRLGVSAGVPLAIGTAFWPGVAPAVGALLGVGLLAARRRLRVLAAGAVAAA
ncbi:MAG TPA: glycosyltransferase family 2 protein, partial [Actinomycetota bacterium]|nr:glycosyltransferase family 2 protein [Actinomycetota bacterium]